MGGRGSGRSFAMFLPAEGTHPWDRQPGESSKAYAAFSTYRDMGAERTLAKASETIGKKAFNLERWSQRWGWVARSAAWDSYVERSNREALLEESAKKAKERLQVAELMVGVSAKSLALWSRKLDHVVRQMRAAEEEARAEGRPIPEPPPSPISPSDTQKLADTGVKLVQLLEGRPTEIEEQRMQLTIEDQRKGIRELIGDPRLRAAMKGVAEALEARGTDPDAAAH